MTARALYTVEMRVYDPTVGSERTLYFANRGFSSGRGDTPFDTHFDARVRRPALAKRELFAAGTTRGRSRVGFGDLELLNGDGALDFFQDCGVDGQDLIIRRGAPGAAYPSGFATLLTATMAKVDVRSDIVTVKLRDFQFRLDVPLQPTLYAGDNVLPDGLEGVAEDLLGKPKPRCFGVVRNVSPPCVNTAKLIYQVNDGPVAGIDAVYDRGIALVNTIFGAVTSSFGATNINHCCSSGPRYVACGNGGAVAYSTDGENWTQGSGAGSDHLFGSCYAPDLDLFVVAGANGSLATSADGGVTYTVRASAATAFGADSIIGLCWAAPLGLFVAVGTNGEIATSPDGVTWTARTSGTAETLLAVLYGAGRIVAIGATNTALVSDDGITWAPAEVSIVGAGFELAYHDRWGFVAAMDNATTAYSRDGRAWTTITVPTSGGIRGITVANGMFVSVTEVGYVQYSLDGGRTWTLANPEASLGSALNMVTFGDAGLVYVGAGGVAGLAPQRRADYADESEILNDDMAPVPGQIGVWPAGGMFRLGAPPDGLVTADVTEGESAADRTAGQIFARLLADPISGVLAEWNADDIAALDVAAPYELGVYVDQSEMTVAGIVDLVAMSVGAYWFADRTGTFRIAVLTAPSGDPVATLVASDLLRTPERLPTADDGSGIPSYRTVVRYARNYTVQTTDLAGGVHDARRASLGKEWQEASYEDLPVQERHRLAGVTVEDSLLVNAADALTEATRRQAMYGTLRHRYSLDVPLDDETQLIDLADVVELDHARYGFAGGQLLRVLDWVPDVGGEMDHLQVTGWR